jgi:membrane protein implicated in regulation of membrane protease activity
MRPRRYWTSGAEAEKRMLWWQWAVAGLALVALEMLTPGGFYLVFFGLGALLVAAIVGIGLIDTLWVQWLAFSILSIAGLLLFRNPLLRWMKQRTGETRAIDSLVGETAIPSEDLKPGAIGRAELRGSAWQARNAEERVIPAGTRCRVVRVDELVVWIQSERGDL